MNCCMYMIKVKMYTLTCGFNNRNFINLFAIENFNSLVQFVKNNNFKHKKEQRIIIFHFIIIYM